MQIRPYILKETNWKTVKNSKYEVAILPWGATEAHNYHLPYGMDCYQTEEIAAESAKIAWEKGAKCIVLPIIPFGVNTSQMDIPLTINLNPSALGVIVSDIVESLEQQGIKKLIILNGHGGNDFKFIIRELQNKTDVYLSQVNWFTIPFEPGFTYGGDHANELETSLMLHLWPELTLPLSEAGDGKSKKNKIKAIQEGWAWAPREWTKVSDDTGIGNPKEATVEKGKNYFKTVTQKIADFIVDMNEADTNNMYE
jgi:creatinine amidohydrolase